MLAVSWKSKDKSFMFLFLSIFLTREKKEKGGFYEVQITALLR